VNDRIKLAEAMQIPYRSNPGGTLYVGVPDPFTDANDDYAVLGWARKEWGDQYDNWIDFTYALSGDGNYKIGDYARAALKVIE